MSRRQLNPSVSFHQLVFAMRATRNSAQTVNNGATGIIVFDDIDYVLPSTGAYDDGTGRYTCPAPGYYYIGSHIQLADSNVSGVLILAVYKNASEDSRLCFLGKMGTNTENSALGGSCVIKCAAGDVLDVRLTNTSGAAQSTTTTTAHNWLSIYRLSGL